MRLSLPPGAPSNEAIHGFDGLADHGAAEDRSAFDRCDESLVTGSVLVECWKLEQERSARAEGSRQARSLGSGLLARGSARRVGRIAGATIAAASAAVALSALPAVADAFDGGGGTDSFGGGGIDSFGDFGGGDTGFTGDYGGGIADSPGLGSSPGGIGSDADFSNPSDYSSGGDSISTSDINSEYSSGGGGSSGGSSPSSGGGDFGGGGIDSFGGGGIDSFGDFGGGDSSSSWSDGIAGSPGLTSEPGGVSADADFGDPESFDDGGPSFTTAEVNSFMDAEDDGLSVGGLVDSPWQGEVPTADDADFSDPEPAFDVTDDPVISRGPASWIITEPISPDKMSAIFQTSRGIEVSKGLNTATIDWQVSDEAWLSGLVRGEVHRDSFKIGEKAIDTEPFDAGTSVQHGWVESSLNEGDPDYSEQSSGDFTTVNVLEFTVTGRRSVSLPDNQYLGLEARYGRTLSGKLADTDENTEYEREKTTDDGTFTESGTRQVETTNAEGAVGATADATLSAFRGRVSGRLRVDGNIQAGVSSTSVTDEGKVVNSEAPDEYATVERSITATNIMIGVQVKGRGTLGGGDPAGGGRVLGTVAGEGAVSYTYTPEKTVSVDTTNYVGDQEVGGASSEIETVNAPVIGAIQTRESGFSYTLNPDGELSTFETKEVDAGIFTDNATYGDVTVLDDGTVVQNQISTVDSVYGDVRVAEQNTYNPDGSSFERTESFEDGYFTDVRTVTERTTDADGNATVVERTETTDVYGETVTTSRSYAEPAGTAQQP